MYCMDGWLKTELAYPTNASSVISDFKKGEHRKLNTFTSWPFHRPNVIGFRWLRSCFIHLSPSLNPPSDVADPRFITPEQPKPTGFNNSDGQRRGELGQPCGVFTTGGEAQTCSSPVLQCVTCVHLLSVSPLREKKGKL